MRKEQAIHLIRSGKPKEWNSYRSRNPEWTPDLSFLDLTDVDFTPDVTIRASLKYLLVTDARKRLAPFTWNLQKSNLIGTKFPESRLQVECEAEVNTVGQIERRRFAMVNVGGSIYDLSTRFPEGFDPVDAGAILTLDAGGQAGGQHPTTVFISYAWANAEPVLAIDQWLRLKGLHTRIDQRDFFVGSRIRDEVLRVMQACDVILIFFSQQSAGKPWTEFEAETAADLEMEAKKAGRKPPRIIYVVIDDAPLPSPVQTNRIAVMAKGKKFNVVCEELYYGILEISRDTPTIDPKKWDEYVF